MKVYIASGFFNAHQLGLVQAIETYLTERDIEFCSPRLESLVGPGLPNDENAKQKTYDQNMEGIDTADRVIAVLDHSMDSGTIFEIGYAVAAGKKVILLTEVPDILMKLGLRYSNITVEDRDQLEPADIPFVLNATLFYSVLIVGAEAKSTDNVRVTSVENIRQASDDRYYDFICLNMSKRKEDPSLITYLGRSIQEGRKMIVYADSKKSANLMLAYCTPYFCIGPDELEDTLKNLPINNKPSRRTTDDLHIV